MPQLELIARLAFHAEQRGDQVAYRSLVDPGDVWTWRELHRAVQFWAGRFAERLNPGQTILISSPNCPQVAVAVLAGFAAGLKVFLVSPELSEVELLSQIEQANAVAAVCTKRVAERIR